MKRREFITLLGGAVAWPLAGWAQQGDRVRRIGVLTVADENDPLARRLVSAFTQALADLGWTDGPSKNRYDPPSGSAFIRGITGIAIPPAESATFT
jgi:hypothetical protein